MGNETWTKVKKGILKIWHKNHFHFGTKFKELKSKLLPNSFPGVYQLDVLAMPHVLAKLNWKSSLEP